MTLSRLNLSKRTARQHSANPATNKLKKRSAKPTILALAVAQAITMQNAVAANISVNADCTLSQAIISANQDDTTPNSLCVAGSGVDTITLTENQVLEAAYSDGVGLPVITSAIILEGNNHQITRTSNNEQFGILAINTSESVSINDLTISNGIRLQRRGGGGISVPEVGTLELNNVTLENNTASQGGGIWINGFELLNIQNSNISNNTSNNRGGGIYIQNDFYPDPTFYDKNYSTVIIDSQINNNTADNQGGGYFCQ